MWFVMGTDSVILLFSSVWSEAASRGESKRVMCEEIK